MLEAVAVGEMDAVEPVAGHALAEPRRGEETLDEPFPGIGRPVGHERLDRLRIGGKSVQVDRHAADQGARVGRGCRNEPRRRDPLVEEGVDRVVRAGDRRHRGPLERPERPPVPPLRSLRGPGDAGVGGTFPDPRLEDGDLGFGELVLGHPQIGVPMTDRPDQQARVGIPRNDRRPTVSAALPAAAPVEGQAPLDRARGVGVASQAAPGEDRRDVLLERDAPRRTLHRGRLRVRTEGRGRRDHEGQQSLADQGRRTSVVWGMDRHARGR